MSDPKDKQAAYKEVTEMLENGVKSVFTSERYIQYLNFISKFHDYSYNNCILIMCQNPQASYVAGFNDWKNKHKRYVKKGEKGIKIIAPSPYKIEVDAPVYDDNNQPVIIDGKPLTEKKLVQKIGFRVVSVFDVSQTDGEPFIVPEFGNKELNLSVKNYATTFSAIREITPYSVEFADISDGAKGLCSYTNKKITIKNGMSESQNIKTLLHEIAHSRLHDPHGAVDRLTREKREVQAESVAFVVANNLGINTSDYSFDYIAGWSSNQEMKELKESLDIIQKEASLMIQEIQEQYAILTQNKEVQQSADRPDTGLDRDMDGIEDSRDSSHTAQKDLVNFELLNQANISNTLRSEEDNIQKNPAQKQPKYSKEENKRIVESIKQNISIEDYAQKLGYTIQRVGTYLTLKEHDSVRIDPRKNRFVRNSTGTKGSIIDFVMEYEKLDKQSAIEKLAAYLGKAPTPLAKQHSVSVRSAEKIQLVLPEKAKTMRNIFAYLISTRKIDSQIVSEWVKAGNLYQDTHNNCVFVTYDPKGKPSFASQRGTNTEKSFKADVVGSNYDTCHFINNNAQKLIVCEAVIDLMSVQTILKAHGRDLSSYNYLSLNGSTKTQAVINALKSSPTDTVILATDNDNAGRIARNELRALISEYSKDIKIIEYVPQNEKDWNAELISNIQEETSKITDKSSSLSDKKIECQRKANDLNNKLTPSKKQPNKSEPNLS